MWKSGEENYVPTSRHLQSEDVTMILNVLYVPHQIGCRFWDLALREHASINKVELVFCL